jgi:Beta propeller domain
VARPQQASSLSTVTVLTLDPSASAPGPATSVVAAGDTVYATADHLYVAGPTGTTSDPDPYAGASQAGCCAILPPARASTAIYDFAMQSSGAPVFEGAGTVPGWLIDSYAMDEDAQGDLRVASTAQSSGGTTASQITVLDLSGGQLVTVGSVDGLGNGEFIKTVRFIGDVAYVVTFQTFDPLYVVSLANPRHPVLAGELVQPGFSEFLYPVSDQLLIGVGVELTNGEPSSLAVATYDVSDPAHPQRVDSSTLATGYQYVAGGYDPHAFLWWPAADLALVAIPADDQYGTNSLSSGIAAYQVAASGQLTRSATLSHGSTSTTRSAVIDGQVWAFSDSGVLTAGLTDLPASTWHGY